MTTAPATALTYEQLQNIERGVFDAMSAIAAALAHNLILGMTMQSSPGADGKLVPSLMLILHGETSETPQKLILTVPHNGPNFFALLTGVAEICAGVLNEYQQKTGAAPDYFIQKQDVEKLRRNNRSRIILPSRS